jgi:hypothetical protein
MPRLSMPRSEVYAVGSPPVVLRDGVELPLRDWERAARESVVQRLLERGVIRADRTLDEVVQAEVARLAVIEAEASDAPLFLLTEPEDDEDG